ncbi:hypothetical protein L914_01905 [Phytophthora nicotianae]|uniref:Uncharacterized protein n=2 Tax=Phytophthora nicotianae TaxID=4792 RepID=V9FW58_PHYNI|nr:hypothetical protein F443_02013 [Phytophthora nicotianae P1569]ETM54809.1 hypothetical protein L914_01905 [Phytophthora nicotianae]
MEPRANDGHDASGADGTAPLSTRSQPHASATLTWVHTLTGVSTLVRVRHAIDFAYYIDGQKYAPPRVQSTISSRFDDDLVAPPLPVSATDAAPRARSEPRPAADTNENDAALDTLLDSIEQSTPVAHTNQSFQPSTVDSTPVSPSAANHGKVLAAIGDDPDLIRFYLTICQSGARKRPATLENAAEPQRRRYENPGDLVIENDFNPRRLKHAFYPTPSQQQIHDSIAAPAYTGKDPAV